MRSARGPRTRDLLLLTALCLALYLPGLSSLPPIDRDEARFMQSTRQMIESGDFVRPRFQAEDRFRKPAGIYWLQSLSVRLASGGDLSRSWPYRAPSTAGALASVLLTYYFGALWYPRIVALSGAALLAASLLLVVEAHLATTDAALLALTVAAQGCLGALYLAARRGRDGSIRYAAGFWLAHGVAILIKGPVALLISALTIAALPPVRRGEHRGGRLLANLRWHWGVPLMLVIVLPWVIAIAYDTNGAFFPQWWQGDVLPKLISGHESHGAPPGTHLLMLAATFWPGSLALAAALMFVRARQRPVERFCLTWLLPAWLVFEIIPTKLPHYVLPLLPPLALVCARAALAGSAARLPRWAHAATLVWALAGTVAAVALCAGALAGGVQLGATLGAAGVGICVFFSARAALAGRWQRAIPVAVTASVILSMATLGVLLPHSNVLWMSRTAADAIAAHRHSVATPLAAAGYHEPSLVFLAGGEVRLVDPEGLAAFMRQHPTGLGLLAADERPRFEDAAAALGIGATVVWSGDGINYSKGRRTRLLLLAGQRTGEAMEGGDAAAADHQALVTR